MTQVPAILEKKNPFKGKPTLVRRVSDMFKDANYSRSPILFRHASMQKIRHCCQNLNLLPFLLYSFDNSNSSSVVRKMHVYLSCLLQEITINLLIAYKNLRHSVLRCIRLIDKPINAPSRKNAKPNDSLAQPGQTFISFEKPKRRKAAMHPFLIAAVYLAPLLLFCQVIILGSLTVFSKYTPGFIFLISALLLLSGIACKIFTHEKLPQRQCQQAAVNNKCNSKKTQ